MTLAPLLNQLIEKQDKEIMELRAWKAKARPFLESHEKDIQESLYQCNDDDLSEYHNELTELLGGSDDR